MEEEFQIAEDIYAQAAEPRWQARAGRAGILGGTTVAGEGAIGAIQRGLEKNCFRRFNQLTKEEQFDCLISYTTGGENLPNEAIQSVIKYISQMDLSTVANPAGLVWGWVYGTSMLSEDKKHFEGDLAKAETTGVPPFDIVRYWRYLQGLNLKSQEGAPVFQDNTPRLAIKLSGGESPLAVVPISEAKCPKPKNPPKTKFGETVGKVSVIFHDGNNVVQEQQDLWPNDTAESVVLNVAQRLKLPLSCVKWTVQTSIGASTQEFSTSGVAVKVIEKSVYDDHPLKGATITIRTPGLIADKEWEGYQKTADKISEEFKIHKSILILAVYFLPRDNVFSDEKGPRFWWNVVQDDIGMDPELQGLMPETFVDFENILNPLQEEFKVQATMNKKIQKALPILAGLPNPNFSTTMVKETQYSLTGNFVLSPRIDTLEIFNKLMVSFQMPCASVGYYHKVMNNVAVPDNKDGVSWVVDRVNDDLYFYLRTNNLAELQSDSQGLIRLDSDDYAEIKISPEKEEGDQSYFSISMKASNAVSLEDIIRRVVDSLPQKPPSMTLEKTFGSGFFLMKTMPVQKEVLYDFCMNDVICSSVCNIDERYRIYKKYGKITAMIGRNLLAEQRMRIAIQQKKIRARSVELAYFPGIAKVDEDVIVCTIEGGRNMGDVKFLKSCFDKLLQRMIDNSDSHFVDWYCKYLVGVEKFVSRPPRPVSQNLSREKINPGLFESSYSRECQKPPEIVQPPFDEKFNSQIEAGNAMIFPKDADVSTTRPQFGYTCDSESTHPFIGLKENATLDNRVIYPAIPCCYKANQGQKKSLFFKYFRDGKSLDSIGEEVLPAAENLPFGSPPKDLQNPFVDKPLLATHEVATLNKLPMLDKALAVADVKYLDGDVQWLRFGTKRGPTSAVSCLLEAFGGSITEREALLALKNVAASNVACQGMIETTEALEILSQGHYLDPLRWTDALQAVFGVNLIFCVYNRDTNQLGDVVPPYFRRMWLKRDEKLKTAILCINHGGEFSNLKNPQCELIVCAAKGASDVQRLFDSRSKPIRVLQEAISSVMYTQSVASLSVVPEYQASDSNGKVRQLFFTESGFGVTVHTSPLCPATSTLGSGPLTETPVPSEVAIKVLNEKLGCQNIEWVKRDGKLIAVTGVSGTARVFVQIVPQKPSANLSVYVAGNGQEFVAPTDLNKVNSLFLQYNKFRRECNSLTSYVLYLFSNLYGDSDDMTEHLLDFRDENTVVDDGVKYDVQNRLLSLADTVFLTDGGTKVKFSSEKLRVRVMGVLRQEVLYHPDMVKDYRFQRYIRDFYTSSKDFTQSEIFTVFYKKFEYSITRDRKRTNYNLYGGFVFDNSTAYFIQNDLLCEGKKLIAVVYDTLLEAVNASVKFADSGSINGEAHNEWYKICVYHSKDGLAYEETNLVYNFRTAQFYSAGEMAESLPCCCVAATARTHDEQPQKFAALLEL